MELPGDALVNYIFPNNAKMWWSIMIVIYPFITGLMAGAFVVSSLSHVFKIKEFQPIANLALIAAFCFGLFAAMPLLVHLGQPQRAFEIYYTPHFTSAMSMFGYFYASYMLILMIEIWLIYRGYFIRMANETTGFRGLVWYVLTLGVTVHDPESAKIDHKLATILAGVGIPWAFALHGYVGFVFGSVKAVAWWATALQPPIFLTSAMVSGMAVLFLMYSFIVWRRRARHDESLIRKFMAFLWAIFIIDYTLEVLEVAFVAYEQVWHWTIVKPLLQGPLFTSYLVWQMGILAVVPFLILGYVVLSKVSGKAMLYLANLGCLLLLMQVLVMRFNVVIGGQLISKSGRGFVDFHWEFFDKEGLLTAAVLLSAPFVAYYIISRFIPIFEPTTGEIEQGSAGPVD